MIRATLAGALARSSWLWFVFALPLSGCAACGKSAVCSFRGTINEPANRSMRQGILRKGLAETCRKLTTRNAPLRLHPDSPIIGRFYPQACEQSETDAGTLYLRFTGFGYAFTNVSKKMSFTMGGAVDYGYDFLVAKEECDIYTYLRPKRIDASDFRVHRIESTVTSFLSSLSPLADNFGKQLVSTKLREGVTVIHDREGNDVVGLGIIPVGTQPPHPYDVHGQDRYTYENDRVELHSHQRDFIGPIEVGDDGRAIFVRARVEGAPAVDVLLMTKEAADASLRLYFDYPQVGPLAAAPIAGDVASADRELTKAFPVGRGLYYVVFDHSASAGIVAPPGAQFDDRAATINYAVQIGDAP